MTELAFLGTGVMGLPMILNLDEAGFAVHAYNRTVARARPLQDEGIAVFSDDMAATTATMTLPAPPQMRQPTWRICSSHR